MKKSSTLHSKVLLIFILTILSACQSTGNFNNDELENAPGAYTYAEGESKYTDLYRDAARHIGNNELVEAEEIYRELIQVEPENFNGYIGLGSSLFFQGRYEEAREAYQNAVALYPDAVQAFIGIGSTYSASGLYEQALDAYKKAIEINPEEINAYWGAVIVMDQEGYPAEEIILYLEKIVELDPSSSVAQQAQNWMDRLLAEN